MFSLDFEIIQITATFLNMKKKSIKGTQVSFWGVLFLLSCNLDVIPDEGVLGTVSELSCSESVVSGILVSGEAVSNVAITVPYTGGDGGVYSGQAVNSTGVTGLTARLEAGTLSSGSGSLVYNISGTPTAAGTTNFELNIGGKTCNLSITVHSTPGSIGTLYCTSASLIGNLTAGVMAQGVTVSIPYNNGNGGSHNGQTVNSTGVTGLLAKLEAGTFASGSGSLVYSISGTPSAGGTTNFELNIGGETCNLSITVPETPGSIGMLDCSSAGLSGSLTAGATISGINMYIPYTNGNGGSHSGQTVYSTGVTGLTATLAAGTFANGNGNLVYSISGTPSDTGTAILSINVGGVTCEIGITAFGRCNAKINENHTRTFMCYNLGSANMSADPFTPSWEINGGYWQWGGSSQAGAGPTGPNAGQANAGTILDWNVNSAPNGTWSDDTKMNSDPCPAGFRIPTQLMWDGIITNNLLTSIGTWSNTFTNYSSGIKFGANLFLPSAGYRYSSVGALNNRGYAGYYWSSTSINSFDTAWSLFLSNNNAGTYEANRTSGFSVRCISE
jgi:uncharacterized protein (TIGR02145 family)